ncbi:type II TA system antitoxin MqsA family protein [Lederbergia citrisecunda]|uniref:type II TA system antitoxin MqsA family protein n=1 Tax=Lederbergia citrisecunda TaxID=2833583 RepID=UPI003D2BA47A
MIIKIYCSKCMEKVPYVVKEEKFILTVRNEKFLIEGKRIYCSIDNEELFHAEFDSENQEKAFNLYREKYNIVYPEDIKKVRERYRLTQREYSYLLGFGEITLSRYERGSLPTIAQNNMIKASFDPVKFYEMLPDEHVKISNERLEEIKERLKFLITEH